MNKFITKRYNCKCGSNGFYTEKKGIHVGLFCYQCNSFIKWISKGEINSLTLDTKKHLNSIYGVKESEEKEMQIDIKYFEGAEELKINKVGDWIDLSTRKDIYIQAGKSELIPLGVAMKLPEGYEAILAPRSSTFKRYGVIQTNSIGVIDESYCGDNDEWCMSVYATQETVIPKGVRIAQFRIIEHQPMISFNKVAHLDSPDRGGFGSTGV